MTKALKFNTGEWVEINKEDNKVVAHAATFERIANKVKKVNDVILVPSQQQVEGFVI